MVAPHPGREALEGAHAAGVVDDRRSALDPAVHRRRVRPVRLDRHQVEAARLDQRLRDLGAHPVELGGAVARLADQHEPRVADPLEQRAEIVPLDRVEAQRLLAHEMGDARRTARRARGAPVPRLLRLPALCADQRHEADVAEVLAREAAVGLARHAHELLELAPLADRHHEPPAGRELVEQRRGHARPAGRHHDRVVGRVLGPAERAVAVADRHVREPELARGGARRARPAPRVARSCRRCARSGRGSPRRSPSRCRSRARGRRATSASAAVISATM